jgi:hypothetical protein
MNAKYKNKVNFNNKTNFILTITINEIMKKNVLSILVTLLFLVSSSVLAQVEVTNYGDIPESRLAASRWEHFEWQDPGNWTTIDVTKEGIKPNSSEDIGQKLSDLIANGSGNRIFKFPAGTYNISSSVQINKSNVQILGAGKSTKFLLPGGNNPAVISIRGSIGGDYTMTANATRGANEIKLTSTNDIEVGTYIILSQAGSGVRDGDPETQIMMVTKKSGNTLTLDMNLGIPFFKDRTEIRRFGSSQNVKLSNFYLERTTMPTPQGNNPRSHNIELINARNVEISKVESNKAYSTHITLSRCTDVIVKENNIYGNYGGSGGTQGGVTMNFCTKIHVINNRTSDLRHHIVSQFGTNHCVIAYNRALAPYNAYQDIGQHNSKGCHNNLFEGNYGKQIFDDNNVNKGWGTRYTMWYRNHATDIIGCDHDSSDHNNIIGNELKSASQTAAISKGTDNLVGANIFSINAEGGTGNLVWKDIDSKAALPPSLFLKNKPDYVTRWPLYGPKASILSTNSFQENKTFTVYPNPSLSGIFQLNDVFEYQLYNLLGVLIVQEKSDKINLVKEPHGIYLLKIGTQNVKLIW